MQTTDKVQTGDSTIGTSTGTSYSYTSNNHSYNAEKGWECPRCGRINAPWVRQCDCSGNNWTITSNWTYKPDWWKDSEHWWKEVTCDSDTFKVHPDSTVYQVGGSDYKTENTYVNVSGTQSNKVDPNVPAWSYTYKTDVPKTYTTVR